MKKLSFALVGAATLALAACGGKKEEAAENVQENYENVAENYEAAAENTSNEAEAETLQNQADQLKAEGENKAEAIEESDTNGATTGDSAVNAM